MMGCEWGRRIILRFTLSFKNISTHSAQYELMLKRLPSRYATEGKLSYKSTKVASSPADQGLAGKFAKRSLWIRFNGFGRLKIIITTDIFPAFSLAIDDNGWLAPAETIPGAPSKWTENSGIEHLWKFRASSYTPFGGITTLWYLVWCWAAPRQGFRRAKFRLANWSAGI